MNFSCIIYGVIKMDINVVLNKIYNYKAVPKKSLENVKAKIAGVVVNRVEGGNRNYYSKYYE